MRVITKSEIEQLKVKLQTSIRTLLTSCTLNADDEQLIIRAMEYIVKNHGAFDEQFYRINEFIYVTEALRKKYEKNKPTNHVYREPNPFDFAADDNFNPF